jgi:hypothetical protein
MSISSFLTRRGRILLAGVAATAFAAGAGAGSAQAAFVVNDPALDVPADRVEHVVREVTIKGAFPRHTLDELWLTADKSRWISRDAATGAVVRETTFDRGTSLTYDGGDNTITEMRDEVSAPPWQTVAQEAAVWRNAFETGTTKQIGETTGLGGRRALVLQSVPEKWRTDEPTQTTTMVVDAETFTPYDLESVLPKHDFSQDVAIRSLETLGRADATEGVFAMGAHAGARRVAFAAKKQGAKKPAAKKRATKKHAARKPAPRRGHR